VAVVQPKKKLTCKECGYTPHYQKSDALCWRHGLCNNCFKRIPKKKLICSQCNHISQNPKWGLCWTYGLCGKCFEHSPIQLERRRSERRNKPKKKKLICSQCGFTPFFSKSKRPCWGYKLCWKCFSRSPMGLKRRRNNLTRWRKNHPKPKKKLTCKECGYTSRRYEPKSLCWGYGLCYKCFERTPDGIERDRIRSASYRQDNVENVKASSLRWYYNNPEKTTKNRRKYCQENKLRVWVYGTIRKHRKDGYDVQVTGDDILEKIRVVIFCRYCGESLQYNKKKMVAVDRIDNEQIMTNDNTQIICYYCNSRKKNLTHLEFIEYCKRMSNKHSRLVEYYKQITNRFSFTEIQTNSQQELKSWEEVAEKLIDRQKREEEDRMKLYDMLDKQFPGWEDHHLKSLGFHKGPLTLEARKKIEDLLEWLNINPEENSMVAV
jgi:predicted nucleic-acid-binding Zn-ribbon protein